MTLQGQRFLYNLPGVHCLWLLTTDKRIISASQVMLPGEHEFGIRDDTSNLRVVVHADGRICIPGFISEFIFLCSSFLDLINRWYKFGYS